MSVLRLPMPSSSRRALYRIIYPAAEQPTFEVGRYVYAVVDCSERGLRYDVKDGRVPSLGTPLAGTLQFRRGGGIELTGAVIRTRAGMVALELDSPGISFSDILAEQRYLRSRGYNLKD